jgi:hypothetical protein
MHTRPSPWFVAFVVVAAIVGAEVGDYIERESRLSFGFFGFIAVLWLVAVIVALVFIGLVSMAFRSKRFGLTVIAVASALTRWPSRPLGRPGGSGADPARRRVLAAYETRDGVASRARSEPIPSRVRQRLRRLPTYQGDTR